MWIFEPSSADRSKTMSEPIPSNGISYSSVVKSNVPRVPVPEVAVTKFSSTMSPSVSVSS